MSSTTQRLDPAEIQARLDAIYDHFRESFAANLMTIDQAMRQLEAGALDEAERRAAESAAHRVAGAAETVGFPAATAPARRLECAFGDGGMRPDSTDLLRADVAALRGILLVPQRRVC